MRNVVQVEEKWEWGKKLVFKKGRNPDFLTIAIQGIAQVFMTASLSTVVFAVLRMLFVLIKQWSDIGRPTRTDRIACMARKKITP